MDKEKKNITKEIKSTNKINSKIAEETEEKVSPKKGTKKVRSRQKP